jgi:hypothetical protein
MDYSVANPGSGAFLTFDPGSRMCKKLGSGSWMNNPDHIAESLETIFGLKFDTDPGSGMKNFDQGWKKFGYGIRDPGSATMLDYESRIGSVAVLTVGTFTLVCKENKSLKRHKTV